MPLFVRRPPQYKPSENPTPSGIHDFIGKKERVVEPLSAPFTATPQMPALVQNPLAQHLPQHRQQQRFPQRLPQPQQPPPQMASPVPPSQQPTPPPSPENAADHFRRLNKSLPDGVMYEPVDKDILRLLKENSQTPPDSPPQTISEQPPVPPTQPSPVALASEIADILESLAQDERNAQIFYSHIAEAAPEERQKKSLTVLAKGCEARLLNYKVMLNTSFEREFSPKETEINIKLEFTAAIQLAITEENKALTTLSDLLDQVAETALEKQVLRLLNKKILTQQMLLAL